MGSRMLLYLGLVVINIKWYTAWSLVIYLLIIFQDTKHINEMTQVNYMGKNYGKSLGPWIIFYRVLLFSHCFFTYNAEIWLINRRSLPWKQLFNSFDIAHLCVISSQYEWVKNKIRNCDKKCTAFENSFCFLEYYNVIIYTNSINKF